jgi:hypothetical protein
MDDQGAAKMPLRRPRVTIVTACPFWRHGAGFWARTRAVIRFLGRHTDLRVIYVDILPQAVSQQALSALGVPYRFAAPVGQSGLTKDRVHRWLAHTLAQESADVYWVDKTELSRLLGLLPPAACRFVDTHDLMSKRYQSFASQGITNMPRMLPEVSEEQERAILSNYDVVVCIQQEDSETVTGWLGTGRAVLAPHPAELSRQELRPTASSIGFIASNWVANVDGLRWFIDAVWPRVVRPGVFLDVYGYVCASFVDLKVPGLRLRGHVATLGDAYGAIDIVINPVRCGAGLKIKTVEALANGLPTVSTSEGARGLLDLSGSALQVADTPAAFAEALCRLLDDAVERRRLGEAAYLAAVHRFTPDACFTQVLRRIEQCSRKARSSE